MMQYSNSSKHHNPHRVRRILDREQSLAVAQLLMNLRRSITTLDICGEWGGEREATLEMSHGHVYVQGRAPQKRLSALQVPRAASLVGCRPSAFTPSARADSNVGSAPVITHWSAACLRSLRRLTLRRRRKGSRSACVRWLHVRLLHSVCLTHGRTYGGGVAAAAARGPARQRRLPSSCSSASAAQGSARCSQTSPLAPSPAAFRTSMQADIAT